MPVVGVLSLGWPGQYDLRDMEPFRRGLGEAGYVDGQNVVIENRYGEGKIERMPALAADLLDRKVNLLVNRNGALAAARSATTTVPIVSIFGGDPVKNGYVATLNRPGGNITSVFQFATTLGGKRIQLLNQIIPDAKVVAILVNSSSRLREQTADVREMEATAQTAKLKTLIVNASSEEDLERAFGSMITQKTDALIIAGDPLLLYLHNRSLRSRRVMHSR